MSYTLPFGITGTFFAGSLCDFHGHCGFYFGGGGGAGAGAGFSAGVHGSFSNGNTICAMGGPFANYSGTYGEALAGTVDYFDGAGDAPGGTVRGSGVTLGIGGGGSASVMVTGTHIHAGGPHRCVNGVLQ